MSQWKCTALSFTRFGLVGLSGVVINLLVLAALVRVGGPHLLASFLATEVAIVNNFTWNNLWTFKQQAALSTYSNLTCFMRCFLVSNLTALLTLGLFAVFSGIGGWHYLLAQVGAIGISMVVNFLVSCQFIWQYPCKALETSYSALGKHKWLEKYARDFALCKRFISEL